MNVRTVAKMLSLLMPVCLFAFLASPARGQTMIKDYTEAITYYTEDYPPYNMGEENKPPTGRSSDLLAEMFRKMGNSKSRADIQLVPWARGYQAVLKGTDATVSMAALYSTSRTPEREQLFRWVCPLAPATNEIIVLKAKAQNFKASALATLRMGVIRDDVGEQVLTSHYKLGPEARITRVRDLVQLMDLLELDRIDAVSYSYEGLRWSLRTSRPASSDKLAVADTVKLGDYCLAFSLNVSPEAVAAHQKALDSVLATPAIVNAIRKKYL